MPAHQHDSLVKGSGTYNGRLERRLDLLLPQSLEIDMTSKEWMVPDILGALDTESLGRIPV
jgi:hypothetical protein